MSKRTQLKACLDLHGVPVPSGRQPKNYLTMMGDVMQRTAGLRPRRRCAGPGLRGRRVHRRLSETGLNIWDVAAGSLLVTEAGGLVGNFTGESDFLEQKECLAGSPHLRATGADSGQSTAICRCRRQGRTAPGRRGTAAAADETPASDDTGADEDANF